MTARRSNRVLDKGRRDVRAIEEARRCGTRRSVRERDREREVSSPASETSPTKGWKLLSIARAAKRRAIASGLTISPASLLIVVRDDFTAASPSARRISMRTLLQNRNYY